MDPEIASFQPRDDLWSVRSDVMRVQQKQSELEERVARMERRQDDDSRLKNVWGTSSPFPSVLGGTPQQVPLQQPTAEHFSHFDGNSSNLIGNLQLDADDEPRRIGTTSRANSVRFDETANHGHWAHTSRSSLDLIPRTGSGLGGHLMSERSYSHKSDGRQSSTGHSVHSATSGRANSLTSGFGLNTPLEPPGLAPGLFILGPVPAIIRCWLNTNFKHSTLLYAAVSSGSYTSLLDLRLIEHLGFQDRMTTEEDGSRKVKLPVFLPEAVPLSSSSRSSSPAPQLPSVSVEFTVVDREESDRDPKAIQIFLGSDMLRAHNADILLSSNQVTLFDDDDSKLQIPLVRPEDERTFKSLYISSSIPASRRPQTERERRAPVALHLGAEGEGSVTSSTLERVGPTGSKADGTPPFSASEDDVSSGRPSLEQPPSLGLTTNRLESRDGNEDSPATSAPRSGTSSAIWSNWRRDTDKPGTMEWANVGKAPSSTYQRRDTGIKVLKPSKPGTTRTLSSGVSQSSSPSTIGQSRFFDDGKRRTSSADRPEEPWLRRSVSGEKAKENAPTLTKTRARVLADGTDCASRVHAQTPALLPGRELYRLHGRPPRFTTASIKKRKIVAAAHSNETSTDASTAQAPHEGAAALRSPRSSPLPPSTNPRASASPPRFIPPHMHDEVFEASQDTGTQPRENPPSAASSPSEAYANMTLESRENSTAQEADSTARGQPEQPIRPPPRSSSPAKRPHSDLDDAGKEHMDVDGPADGVRRESNTSKPAPTALRATSVEMADAPSGDSASGSDTASASNQESTATSVSQPSPPRNIPSLDEQVLKVLAIHKEAPTEGQDGYAISEKWLERVFARTTENIQRPQDFNKEATEGEIGPVDNTDLIDPLTLSEDLSDQNGDDFVPLKPGLTIGHDFEVLPPEAWELIISWYGIKEGSPVLRRYAHNTALVDYQENIQYELYPPIFTIRRLRRSATSDTTTQQNVKTAPKLVASRNDSYVDFLRAAKKAVNIDVKTKVQVWRVLSTVNVPQTVQQPSGMLTPDSSPRSGSPAPSSRPPMYMNEPAFTSLTEGIDREMVTGKDETANEKYNGHMNLQIAGLAEDQILILEEQDAKGGYFSEASKKVASKNGVKPGANKTGKGVQSNTTSGRNSPAPSGPMTRGRTRSGRTRGTVGLINLGNTCYMNSALQCIRSVEELSCYFLSQEFKTDINTDNPLGHNGQIAKSYAGLLASIYEESATSAFAPKNFKNTLGRAQPLFSGYGQQDSQEFLSFLVDGLHEDLNRVKKKPYTEYPDSDDHTHEDPAAIIALGEKFRAIHRSRNDSVAMDLFNGFYKNTMVCPECDKVSITFDPYSLLTLQLPVEQTWQHTITFVPLYGRMVNVEIDIDKNASIKALKEYVAKRFPGVKPERLMGAEIYSHKFYRVLEDKKAISESNISARDDIFFFELESVPTNWPPKKKKKQQTRSYMFHAASSEEDIPGSDSPLADRMLIPVFHRGPNMSTYRAQQWSMVLWPSYIVVTREEAKDYDAILRKILAKVAQMTTRDIFEEQIGTSTPLDQSRNGSDVVLTTEEDASPNGDPRVQDGSVEGEDMVEVTMTEPTKIAVDQQTAETRDHSPEILKPGAFIPPEYRQLFEIKHTRAGQEMVQTGWSSVDASKAYELISKRIRTPPSRESSVQSLDETSNASSSEEADDTLQFSSTAQNSIAEANQSSEDEIPSIETPNFARGGRQKNSKKNKRKNKKALKTYGKKGKDRFAEQPSKSFSEPESEDDESLVRLGEALVLEWNANAFDAFFEGTNLQDSRGMDTLKFVETLDDPELQAKKAKRAARRKHGITLDECFAESSKSEVLSEDNAWYCNRCKEMRRATKTLEIWTAPDILVVHLKRFSSHRAFRDKIEALVDFPIEGLDLTGKVGLPEGKELIYDLFAVDNHYGGLGGGHYTAYAQNFFDKKWYEYNDSSVSTRNNPQNVVTSSAYLLFYRRRSSVPLGPPYLQEIDEKFLNPSSDDPEDSRDDEATSRNPSPSGNGLRLGDSARNGSSSAGAAAAGVGALRGGGSALARENHPQNGAAVETQADEETDDPPAYDEGYGGGEDEDDANFNGVPHIDIEQLYQPLYDNPVYGGGYHNTEPGWSFNGLGGGMGGGGGGGEDTDDAFDDTASDAPMMGSATGDEVDQRLLEDFGDELMHPGQSSPVADIRLDDEVDAALKEKAA
ncbi:hypothetical protein BDV96DRAFT_607854 [Lophiotrema nucula]|uniref:ubiquitinyl hydrolase 1 n=1 Tax=Lophiotrema nucula TaxID=690887 RepID=A0A6A5YIA7_9PLEO|nr:hypothetical protein BDV96DRAFT_607854 [Lophiotrema nucula]